MFAERQEDEGDHMAQLHHSYTAGSRHAAAWLSCKEMQRGRPSPEAAAGRISNGPTRRIDAPPELAFSCSHAQSWLQAFHAKRKSTW